MCEKSWNLLTYFSIRIFPFIYNLITQKSTPKVREIKTIYNSFGLTTLIYFNLHKKCENPITKIIEINQIRPNKWKNVSKTQTIPQPTERTTNVV